MKLFSFFTFFIKKHKLIYIQQFFFTDSKLLLFKLNIAFIIMATVHITTFLLNGQWIKFASG